MKIEKNELSTKLNKLKNAIPARPTFESLKGVLLENGTLYANNLDMAMATQLNVESEECFIIPFKAIEMINNLPDGIVDITSDEKYVVTIKINGIKNKFKSLAPSTFVKPDIEKKESKTVGIDSKEFKKAISSVLYAVAQIEGNKPVLSGVYMECEDGILNIVGCDGYRIAWAKLNYDDDFCLNIPRNTAQKLVQHCGDGNIEINFTNTMAIFKSNDLIIWTRIIDGDYLKYKQTFTTTKNSAIVNRNDLIDSISRAAICSDEKSRYFVELQFLNQSLTVISKESLSDYAESIRLESPIDNNIKIAFNGKYLIELLKSYSCDNLELYFSGELSPMLILENELSSLLLPIRR